MKRRASAVLASAALVMGCSSMLPRGTSDTPSPFESFDQARAAAESIAPFKTTVDQLKTLGFDRDEGKNVTLIPYPDVLARLAPYSGVPMEELDPGIRECIKAKTACRAWLFHFERQDRHREGGFVGDFLNVKRVTKTTGWSFDALVVANDGVVLFRNWGGQPNTDKLERQINPLGPLQPAGESAGALLR
jgi:hypothetical protein